MEPITLHSPAKINLCLSVLGKRSDGYHEVEMLMQMVGLYDEITVALAPSGISVACDGAAPSGEGNIAWKAGREILLAAQSSAGLSISIKKSIPVAAGLGGGSGNAAAVMLAASRLLKTGFGPERLAEIGGRIGMDVPFFFFGPTALARGRGEEVTPVPPPPPCWALLVNPGFATSTAWVYQNVNLRLTKKVDCTKIARLTVRMMAEKLHNDLETVTAAAHPVIGTIAAALSSEGALGVRMSGSGPTVFGIFETEHACRRAADNLAYTGWKLFPARVLAESPFTQYLHGDASSSTQ